MNGFWNTVKSAPDWPFLNEPIYRWFIFLVVISLFAHVWAGVQDHMK